MSDISPALKAILQRLEANENLTPTEQETLVALAKSSDSQVTIAMGERSVAIGGNVTDTVIETGDRHFYVQGADAAAIRALMKTRSQMETQLLKAVRGEVSSRLRQSLQQRALIPIRMTACADKVKRDWDADIKIGEQLPVPIAPNQTLLEIFEQADRKLLILGKPGTGKTTLMLSLASQLCDRAQAQFDQPIPILLNLSTYRVGRRPIWEWIVAELKSKYQPLGNIDIDQLKTQKYMLFLDGLDEVAPMQQGPCVAAINQLTHSEYRIQSLLICSREEEYDSCGELLFLTDAVVLQALTDEQVEQYVEQYLSSVKQHSFLQLLKQDRELYALAHNPFLLTIVVLSRSQMLSQKAESLHQPYAVTEERTQAEDKTQQILDAYIHQMLSRDIRESVYSSRQRPTHQQTQYWLTQIAQILQQEAKTEFLIERLQPSYIKTPNGMMFYLLFGDLALNLISGRAVGIWTVKLKKALGNTTKRSPIYDYLSINVIASLIIDTIELLIFLYYASERNLSKLKEVMEQEVDVRDFLDEIELYDEMTLSIHWSKVPYQTLTFSLAGAALGIFIHQRQLIALTVPASIVFWTILGAAYGLCLSCFVGLRVRYAASAIERRQSFNITLNRVFLNAVKLTLLNFSSVLLLGTLAGCLMMLAGIEGGLLMGIAIGIGIGAFYALRSSAIRSKPVLQHYLLRVILQQEGTIPKNYVQFLDYCTELSLLQRVGGRYRFFHQLLQSRFAEISLKGKSNHSSTN